MDKFFCYRNLNRKGVVWSVRSTKTGLVVDWATRVVIKNPQLVVSDKGRKRVLAEQRKNVHAGVKGERIKRLPNKKLKLVKATYNPYKYHSFILSETLEPIFEAKYAVLQHDGLWVAL